MTDTRLHYIAVPQIRDYLATRGYQIPHLTVLEAILDSLEDSKIFIPRETHEEIVDKIERGVAQAADAEIVDYDESYAEGATEGYNEGYNEGYADGLRGAPHAIIVHTGKPPTKASTSTPGHTA